MFTTSESNDLNRYYKYLGCCLSRRNETNKNYFSTLCSDERASGGKTIYFQILYFEGVNCKVYSSKELVNAQEELFFNNLNLAESNSDLNIIYIFSADYRDLFLCKSSLNLSTNTSTLLLKVERKVISQQYNLAAIDNRKANVFYFDEDETYSNKTKIRRIQENVVSDFCSIPTNNFSWRSELTNHCQNLDKIIMFPNLARGNGFSFNTITKTITTISLSAFKVTSDINQIYHIYQSPYSENKILVTLNRQIYLYDFGTNTTTELCGEAQNLNNEGFGSYSGYSLVQNYQKNLENRTFLNCCVAAYSNYESNAIIYEYNFKFEVLPLPAKGVATLNQKVNNGGTTVSANSSFTISTLGVRALSANNISGTVKISNVTI